mgnify:CR=1 FL=1
MFSEKDFERLWFFYKTEDDPKGVTINSFCISRFRQVMKNRMLLKTSPNYLPELHDMRCKAQHICEIIRG